MTGKIPPQFLRKKKKRILAVPSTLDFQTPEESEMDRQNNEMLYGRYPY